MKSPMLPVIALGVVLAGTALPARAQQPTPIRVGQTVTGTLAPSDPVMGGNGPFHVYTVQANAGQRLIATLRSGAFDALLTLMRPIAGIHEVVNSDDDGGGGTDSRLRWTAPAAGVYQVVVQALGTDGRGGYTLLVEEAPPARRATPQAMAVGESRTGTLTEGSPLLMTDGEEIFYDAYAIDARTGDELVITLTSSDFDAFLQFGPLHGDSVEVTDSDDDGGGSMNSRLRVTIPANGRYGVYARGLSEGSVGGYTLAVRKAVVTAPRPITAGAVVEAALGGDSDSDYHDWIYRGRAGETIRVRMQSDDFDTVLTIGTLANGQLRELASNDDEGESTTNSFVEVTLPAAGEYVIRAAAYSPGTTGPYTLRVEAGGR